MVGLQGSGKTTTCAKLARLLKKEGKRPLLVAADMQRPAAVEQLKILGEQVGVPVFNVGGATPLEICTQALAQARAAKHDVVIYDAAGRARRSTSPSCEEAPGPSRPPWRQRTCSSWSMR